MQKGGGMSFWPKPILHLDKPQGDDPNMIIINKCGLCGNGTTMVTLLSPLA
jgi:hypothetical protein